MTAQILYLRDFKRKEEKPTEQSLEQMACEVMGVAFYPSDQAAHEAYNANDKARLGMPGIMLTEDGDLINVGAPEKNPA